MLVDGRIWKLVTVNLCRELFQNARKKVSFEMAIIEEGERGFGWTSIDWITNDAKLEASYS